MSATAKATVGVRVELARYVISAGERVIYGQRVDGVVRVTDTPAQPGARSFLVERELTSQAELEALVADYTRQSVLRDEPAALVRIGDELAVRLGRGARQERRHA